MKRMTGAKTEKNHGQMRKTMLLLFLFVFFLGFSLDVRKGRISKHTLQIALNTPQNPSLTSFSLFWPLFLIGGYQDEKDESTSASSWRWRKPGLLSFVWFFLGVSFLLLFMLHFFLFFSSWWPCQHRSPERLRLDYSAWILGGMAPGPQQCSYCLRLELG